MSNCDTQTIQYSQQPERFLSFAPVKADWHPLSHALNDLQVQVSDLACAEWLTMVEFERDCESETESMRDSIREREWRYQYIRLLGAKCPQNPSPRIDD